MESKVLFGTCEIGSSTRHANGELKEGFAICVCQGRDGGWRDAFTSQYRDNVWEATELGEDLGRAHSWRGRSGSAPKEEEKEPAKAFSGS